MRIGLFSDTHQKTEYAKDVLEFFVEQNVEFIVHAGDIVELDVLNFLKNCDIEYVAVFGNNDAHLLNYQDSYNLVQEPYYFNLAKSRFKLMHLPFYMTPDSEVVIFGHTHEFHIEFTDSGTLYLNPGETCAREKPLIECAILELSDDYFDVTRYFKEPKETLFNSKEYSFQRKKNQ